MQKYSQIAKLLQKCQNSKSSLKSIIFKSSQDQTFIRQAYALMIRALKHQIVLNKIVDDLECNHEIRDRQLAIILILELFNPEKRNTKKMGGALIRILKQNQSTILALLNQSKVFEKEVPQDTTLRLIETNMTEQSKQLFAALNPIPDTHVPNLFRLTYENYSQLIRSQLNENWFISQSKSSAMPPYLLLRCLDKYVQDYQSKGKEIPSFDIVDCCAAPGNKTLQLAEYVKTHKLNSKVLAFEKSSQRFEILKNRIAHYGFQEIVQCFNKDFLQIKTQSNIFKRVKFILLDPSCSGSGMRQQSLVEIDKEKDQIKINSLASLQGQLLNKCSQFPRVSRLSYSTCSIYEEENENVANEFLRQNPRWKAVKICNEWEHRGLGNLNYIRFNQIRDQTDGFFIAMFKRLN